MHYPITASSEEIFAVRSQPIDEEMIVVVSAGVVKLARS